MHGGKGVINVGRVVCFGAACGAARRDWGTLGLQGNGVSNRSGSRRRTAAHPLVVLGEEGGLVAADLSSFQRVPNELFDPVGFEVEGLWGASYHGLLN